MPGPRTLRIESEKDPQWDDLVEEFQNADGERHRHGFQVKLQNNPFDADAFATLLRNLKTSKRLARGCLVVPGPIGVQEAGRLWVLKEMCLRASQPGCDPEALRTTKEEQVWWRFLGKIMNSDADRLALLRRLEVNFSGDEAYVKS